MLGLILWRAKQKESDPKYPSGSVDVKTKDSRAQNSQYSWSKG